MILAFGRRKLPSMLIPSTPWLSLCAGLLVVGYLCPNGGAAADVSVDEVLDQQEQDMINLAGFVLQNYLNSSALVENCEAHCSRRICQPLTTDAFECAYGGQNPDCLTRDNSGNCNTTVVDWNQSFVTGRFSSCRVMLGSQTDFPSVERSLSYVSWAEGSIDANLESEPPTCAMRKTVCAQKQLDTQFFLKQNKSANMRLQLLTYFGASNGIHRHYPGKDWNDTACSIYDVRTRPWYTAATGMIKDIVLFLDYGPSLGNNLSPNVAGTSVFDALKNITLRALTTLTYQDRISIFSLSNVATLVGNQTVPKNPDGSINADKTVFQMLNNQVQKLENPGDKSNPDANLTEGLNMALSQFIPQSTLKIIILLTRGQLTGEYLDESLVNKLSLANVTVFIFRVGAFNDDLTTLLQNASCVLKGGYVEHVYHAQDPFEVLQPFYSYVARLRFDQDQKRPYWVTKYSSFSGEANIVTVSRPVFDENIFLGVVSRDISLDYLGNITTDLNDVFSTSKRNSGNALSLDPENYTTIPCKQVNSPNQTCPSILDSGEVTGFCTNVNPLITLVGRLCCNDNRCPWPFARSSDGSGKTGLKIGLSLSLSLLAVVVTLVGPIWWWMRRGRHEQRSRRPVLKPHFAEES